MIATRTEVIQVDSLEPDAKAIARAARVLRGGGLVAFPTETVYGLGANALDTNAVARIFEAKGRPATNPVIVHVARREQLAEVVGEWPEAAIKLSARFWPGPLSFVLKKHPRIPDKITAGGPTVAVRMPAHPVAERLLLAGEVPIAAPSANRSTRISPTSAEHVLRMLDGRIDLVLDGGSTPGGIESTVIDLTVEPITVLRPGLVSRDEIAAVLDRDVAIRSATAEGSAKSPGQLARHYAPQVPLECSVDGGCARVQELAAQGVRVGWLCWEGTESTAPHEAERIAMPRDAQRYATRLYAALHRFEEMGVERIVVDFPPDQDAWHAVRDRLMRASH